MLTDDKQIDTCIEHICQQGCRAVNQIIDQLEQGKYIEVIQHLNIEQRQKLYQELKTIMAVYAETNSCEIKNN